MNLTPKELHELQREWQQSKSRMTNRMLLETFPDVVEQLPELLKNLDARESMLRAKIKIEIANIHIKTKDEFSRWFCIELVKHAYVSQLQEFVVLKRRLRGILALTQDYADKSADQFDALLEHARTVPIETVMPAQNIQRQFGNRAKALCPLHDERTPSFTLYKDSNRYWCFGCGQGGDVINLVQSLQQSTFKEAVEYLSHYN